MTTANDCPRVSVIMPAYNVEAFIGEAIQSVIDQTFTDWELIIVDDGSADATYREVSRFADPRISCHRQANAGPSAARRAGLGLARARYVLLFDADDRIRPDTLARLSARLDQVPEACVAYGDEVFMTEDGHVLGSLQGPRFAPRPSGDVLRDILRRNFIFHGAALVRMGSLERAGYDYDGKVNEDWVIWCALAALGAFSYIGKGPILEYRLRPCSLSRISGADVSESLRAIAAVFGNPIIASRFAPAELRLLRTKREAVAYAFSAKQALTRRKWWQGIGFACRAVGKELAVPREFVLPTMILQSIERRWSNE